MANKTYCRPFRRDVSWRSQNFGDNKTKYGPHSGNDEAANIGTPVHAAGDGVIEFAGVFDSTYQDNLLWLMDMGGNVLVLNCGDDEPSFVYAHLDRFTVKAGDRVRKGQIIAYSGNSGTATTGAHLHVEAIPPGYRLNSHLLGRINPDFYFKEWPEDLPAVQATPTDEDEEMAKPIITLMNDKSGTLFATVDFVTKWAIPDPNWVNHYLQIEKWGWIELRRDDKGNHILDLPAFGATV